MSNLTYNKLPWIYKISSAFEGDQISSKRLNQIPEECQKKLIYMTVLTMSKYFSQIPDYDSDTEESPSDPSKSFLKSLNNTLPIWLSGLCDATISQIINALLDILNLKTEYQKWPPKSVIEFYAVCKRVRPPYYDTVKSNYLRLEKVETRESKKKKIETINGIYKKLGRNYKLFLNNQISKIENKENKTEVEIKIYNEAKESLEILGEIEKNTNA